jgi:hypothetical protein
MPYPPVTQLWVLLYAQVHQADNSDLHNLLLSHRQATPRLQRWERRQRPRTDTGTATWSQSEINDTLRLLGLTADTPMSCLVVETLPGDQPHQDPVGADLGYERFLRSSPLTALPAQC